MVTVTLNDVQEKHSKNGNPYWVLQTDGGRFWSTTAVSSDYTGKRVEIAVGGAKGDQAESVRLLPTGAGSNGRNESIEQQVAIKEVGEHIRQDADNVPADISNAYWQWLRERLGLAEDIEPEGV